MYKQNMAYRVGEQVPNHSDKEARINQDVWITDQETFSIAPPMFLLMSGVS